MTEITIASAALSATISPLGAELQVLRDPEGRDLLWSGDPAFWSGRAPVLFPIVGALNGGVYRVDGREYALSQHGFARRRTFALVDRTDTSARFRLEADEGTRAVYPFDFRLDVIHAIEGATLTTIGEVTNEGDESLPCSFGFHPAFAWPLPYGAPRGEHRMVFEREERDPVMAVEGGLLLPPTAPNPVNDRVLRLDDALFVTDAVVMPTPANRSLLYGVEGGPQLRIDWPDMPSLAIWSKPGAGFVCVEPWQGHADPVGFTGEFRDKPGVVEIAPGETRRFGMSVTLVS
ncbi:aldose 1-epimerase family protein [Sphingomonas sp. ID0503]|uniref:aldose 1-epimerase family protein n=1 Tax=Sphingomonas sp. ID0503 TaxID=3399691 RepID=UPI003AFAF47A